MKRLVAHALFVLVALAPVLAVGQTSSDVDTDREPDAGATREADESKVSDDAPDQLAATQFTSLLGVSWSGRSGCQGSWTGKWKVAGGEFSLVVGSTSGTSGSAFHAACNNYRSIGPYTGTTVAVTLLGGVIHRVAVLHGGGSSEQKAKMTRYFESVCDGSREAEEGTKYDTVYEGCGGFDAGVTDGDSSLSLYLFADESVFRSRMNSLPMP